MSPVSTGIQMGQPCPTLRCPLAREGLRAVRPQGWATAGGGTNRVAEQRSCCSSLGPLSLLWLDWHRQMVTPFADWQTGEYQGSSSARFDPCAGERPARGRTQRALLLLWLCPAWERGAVAFGCTDCSLVHSR